MIDLCDVKVMPKECPCCKGVLIEYEGKWSEFDYSERKFCNHCNILYVKGEK